MTTLTEKLEALSEEDRQRVERLTEELRAEARTWSAAADKNPDLSGPCAPPPLAEPHSDLRENDRDRPGTRTAEGRLGARRP